MAPFTSPTGCEDCVHLDQKIKELERRISILCQIQEASLLLGSVQAGAASTGELNSTVSSTASAVAAVIPIALGPVPNDGHWVQLGAKPKAHVSPTFCTHKKG